MVLLARAGSKLNQVAKRLNSQREPINFHFLEDTLPERSYRFERCLPLRKSLTARSNSLGFSRFGKWPHPSITASCAPGTAAA